MLPADEDTSKPWLGDIEVSAVGFSPLEPFGEGFELVVLSVTIRLRGAVKGGNEALTLCMYGRLHKD